MHSRNWNFKIVLSFELAHRILCILFSHPRVDQRMRQENKTETRPGEQNLKFGVKEGMPHTPLTTKKDKKEMKKCLAFLRMNLRNVTLTPEMQEMERKKIKKINYFCKFIFEKLSTVDFNCCEIR